MSNILFYFLACFNYKDAQILNETNIYRQTPLILFILKKLFKKTRI